MTALKRFLMVAAVVAMGVIVNVQPSLAADYGDWCLDELVACCYFWCGWPPDHECESFCACTGGGFFMPYCYCDGASQNCIGTFCE